MAELDKNTIKVRMKDMIQADVSLFDTTTQGNNTHLVEAEVGWPNVADAIKTGKNWPFAFVTSDNAQIDQIVLTGSTVADQIKKLDHIIRIMVVIGAAAENARAAEKLLDGFEKKILDIFEKDVQLKNGGAVLVDQCIPLLVRVHRNELLGTNKLMRDIVFKIKLSTGQP